MDEQKFTRQDHIEEVCRLCRESEDPKTRRLEQEVRDAADAHPDEVPVLRRDVIYDKAETRRRNNGYKCYVSGHVHILWEKFDD